MTLSSAYDQPVLVAYATGNGTATADSDNQAISATLTIPASQTSRTITVLVNGDRVAEPNEPFVVNLSNPNYGVITDPLEATRFAADDPYQQGPP